MKTGKIGALFLVSILALAGASAGYSLWSETITIDGTIHTGTVDIDWSLETYGSDETKDVSIIFAEIIGDTLFITIDNAYPCVNYFFNIDVHCAGTIPVHFKPFEISHGLPGTFTVTPAAGYEPIELTQLHNCERWFGTIVIHLDNTALEGTTYTFSVTLVGGQYNEF